MISSLQPISSSLWSLVLHLYGIIVYPWLSRFPYSFLILTPRYFIFLKGIRSFNFEHQKKKSLQQHKFILKTNVWWFLHNDRMSSKIILITVTAPSQESNTTAKKSTHRTPVLLLACLIRPSVSGLHYPTPCYSKWGSQTGALALPRSLSEMKNLRPHSDLCNQSLHLMKSPDDLYTH